MIYSALMTLVSTVTVSFFAFVVSSVNTLFTRISSREYVTLF